MRSILLFIRFLADVVITIAILLFWGAIGLTCMALGFLLLRLGWQYPSVMTDLAVRVAEGTGMSLWFTGLTVLYVVPLGSIVLGFGCLLGGNQLIRRA